MEILLGVFQKQKQKRKRKKKQKRFYTITASVMKELIVVKNSWENARAIVL